ncbi:MAG TPA: hypothetical protein VMW28_08320 [Pelolinea sp.]|nr:hypothetical protein [Pelolinea sp.]
MKKLTSRQIITILVTLLTIILNVLANALPFNGQGTGEISDRFSILFVPAGYVFSIWGLIYIGMILFTAYQALNSQRENSLIDKIAPAYWIANMANNVWLFLWHWEFFPLTLIAMLTILVSLISLYRQFDKTDSPLTPSEVWLVKIPFSIYLGWISVATIANISQVLFFTGWNGFGLSPEIWTVIMLAVGAGLGILMLLRERDFAYSAVLIWAFIGIAAKQADNPIIVYSAWTAAGLIILWSLITFMIKKPKGE